MTNMSFANKRYFSFSSTLKVVVKGDFLALFLILVGKLQAYLFFYLIFFFGLFAFSRATLAAYGGSQSRGLIRVVAAGLHHSHSNKGSEPSLRPTPQLTATLDP